MQSDPAKTDALAGNAIFDRRLLRRRRARAAGDFAQYDFLKAEAAERVAERLDPIQRSFPLALDLGAHDGALARALGGRCGVERVISTDLAPEFCRARTGHAIAADEEALPIRDESINLAVSALSLHWVNDLPGTLVQINRILKPDGLFIASMFGIGTLDELRTALADAELEISGGVSPHISPFVDARDGAGLLQRAGFALPVADRDTISVTYADPLALLRDLRGMGEGNVLNNRRRTGLSRAVLARALELYVDRHTVAGGRIKASFELVTLTGWAPHESQQKPLRPGSAQRRLADALGTVEQSAGEKAPPTARR